MLQMLFDCRDLKKMTGDWFLDQKVNRFSTTPGHDLVKVSLKKEEPGKEEEKRGVGRIESLFKIYLSYYLINKFF